MNHRDFIISELKKIKFNSLLDVGCGEGMDLELIRKEFPGIEIAGIDKNAERVKVAIDKLGGQYFDEIIVGNITEEMLFDDKSFDVSLANAVLYQNNKKNIEGILREMKRITKKYVFLIENHSEQVEDSDKFREYNVLNYKEILTEIGFKNLNFIKITKEIWPGYPWEYWGYLIIAEV